MFIFQLNDLSTIGIEDEDIVVILWNLLSNAIEACEKYSGKKVIKLKFIKERDDIIISVKNTYNGELEIRDGEIQTSKLYDSDEHGIGIKNIIAVIEKYQGSYAIQNDKEEFYFSIMLPVFKKWFAGCSTLITSKMIARGITDDALYNKTHTILIVSSVLTLIALICILIRAIFLLQEHLNKWDKHTKGWWINWKHVC